MATLRPTGLMPHALTAFKNDYKLDEEAWHHELTWLLDLPFVQVISLFGGAGEGDALTVSEFERALGIALDTCREHGKSPSVNIFGESYEKAEERVEVAAKLGAELVRVVHPHYAVYSPSNLYSYYVDMATQFPDLNFVIYPQKELTARPFPVEVMAQLADIDNVIGAKMSGYSFWELFNLDAMTTGKDFLLIPGGLVYFYHFCKAGINTTASFDGFLTQAAPQQCWGYFQACQNGEWEEALAGLAFLSRLKDVVRGKSGMANFPAREKTALAILGRPVGPARRPKSMPSDADRREIRDGLAELGLLGSAELTAADDGGIVVAATG